MVSTVLITKNAKLRHSPDRPSRSDFVQLGFSKRSFAEWSKQVSISFKETEGVINSLKNTLKTAFVVPIEKDNNWIKNSLGKIVSKENIDSYIPQLTSKTASNLAQQIREQSIAVANAKDRWEEYFAGLKNEKQGYIVDLIKNTDDLSKLTGEDLVKANQQARASALAHNEAIKAQTLSAKTGKVVLQAFATAGNMILFAAIAKGIQFATTALDNWINRSKYAIEAMEKAQQTINDAQNKLKNVSTTIEENKDRFLELSEGVDKFSKNIKLSEEDYAEYLSISNKLAAISPELITGYTEQGDALLYIGNNAEEVREKLNKVLEAEQAIAQQTLVDNMDDVARGIYNEVDKANFDIANLKAELNTVSTVFRDIEDIIKTVDNDIGSIDFGTGSGLNLDFDEMEQLKNAIRNSGAKITEDTVFDSMIFSSSEIPLVQKAIENFYKQLDYTRKNESAAYINGITKDIQARENAIKTEYAKMTPNLVAWVKSTYEYDFLDEQKKNLIESLIPNLDWNDIKDTNNAVIHVTQSDKNNINIAKEHADSQHARVDATKVEKSDTNGNIKINGVETNVYTPSSSTELPLTTSLDATEEGVAALDSTVGKVLKDEIDELNNNLIQ